MRERAFLRSPRLTLRNLLKGLNLQIESLHGCRSPRRIPTFKIINEGDALSESLELLETARLQTKDDCIEFNEESLPLVEFRSYLKEPFEIGEESLVLTDSEEPFEFH